MSRSQTGYDVFSMNSALHAKSSSFYEYADFDRNKYQYDGSDGSCLVLIDSGNRVTKVEFDPPSDVHIR
jgi:hypothetical protein